VRGYNARPLAAKKVDIAPNNIVCREDRQDENFLLGIEGKV
jgi:hypothetical protein